MKSKKLIRVASIGLCGVLSLSLAGVAFSSAAGDYAGQKVEMRQKREAYDEAKSNLVKAHQDYIKEARNSPEFKAAAAEVRNTHDAYKKYMAELKNQTKKEDPAAASAQKELAVVEQQISDARARNAPPDEFSKLYQKKADLKKQLSGGSSAVEHPDDEARKLHDAWQAAAKNMRDLQAKIEDDAPNSDQVKAAQMKLDAARAEVDQGLVDLSVAKTEAKEEARENAQEDYWNEEAADYWRSHPPYRGDDDDDDDDVEYRRSRWWR